MDEEFQKYCERRNMSNAEALRAMVREVLKEDDNSTLFESVEEPGTSVQTLAGFGIVFAWLSAILQYTITINEFASPSAAVAMWTLHSLLMALAAGFIVVAVTMAVLIYPQDDSG
jgi:hypothetical protein